MYRKKLANYLREEECGTDGNNGDHSDFNGNGKVKHNGTGEFSADDEEVEGQEEEEEEETETEDEQPSVQVSKRGAKIVESPAQNTSSLSSMRHRFLGEGRQNHDTSGQRFTPTPRRSIHSYKVTETTKQTMTKNPDGSISRDYDYKKVTSEDKGTIGGSGKIYALLKMLPGFFLLLIVIVVAYYIYSVSSASHSATVA